MSTSSEILKSQVAETVLKDSLGVTARMTLVTCPCGVKRSLVLLYKCLYCGVWFCTPCAEEHFGKTVAQYRQEKAERGECP